MTTVPIWIQLQLDFKYWGIRCLQKLVSPIGKMIKADQATEKREILQYARVMVDVKVDQVFPYQLTFINEKSIEAVFGVMYEWKPDLCTKSKKVGHRAEVCRKINEKQVWRPKESVKPVVEQVDDKEFQLSKQVNRRKEPEPNDMRVENSFSVLGEMDQEDILIGDVICESEVKKDARRGDSPVNHG